MIGTVFKLSYNKIGDDQVEGGICGTCFFIHPQKAITANHLLAKSNYKPNDGYKNCQYWIILQNNKVIPIHKNQLNDYPEIDVTIINFNHQITDRWLKIADNQALLREEIVGLGYRANKMPYLGLKGWSDTGFVIIDANASRCSVRMEGYIKGIGTISINANDIKINNKILIETSFPSGVTGMSGGPILRKATQEVLGLMVIGLPHDVMIKNQILAISAEEIKKKL